MEKEYKGRNVQKGKKDKLRGREVGKWSKRKRGVWRKRKTEKLKETKT